LPFFPRDEFFRVLFCLRQLIYNIITLPKMLKKSM
jgi:hypothetical protein